MSIVPNAYPTTPYRQTPIAWPVKIFDPPGMRPASVMLSFNWTVYFAVMNSATNIAVDVDVNSGGTSQGPVLDKIVTVKIDNSNSLVPILVWFPDSGDIVSCPPQSIATLPCTTNGSICKIIAQNLSTGNLPMTNIIFYNYFIPPSIDPVVQITYPQELGSPSIQRPGSNILSAGFGPRALGDQRVAATANMGVVFNTVIVPRAADLTGFFTITHIYVVFWQNAGGAAPFAFTYKIRREITFDGIFSPAGIPPAGQTIVALALSGMNIKVPANEGISIFNDTAIPSVDVATELHMVYTYNPGF